MLYNPPTGAATVNDAYIGKNVAAGIIGSKLPPKAAETPQREIVNALLAAGLSPTNGDLTQLAQAMSIGLWLGAMGGSANALADTLPTLATTSDGVTQYAIPALMVGMTFHGIVPATNTGPATLTLTGFGTAPGAKPIARRDGTPVQAGDQPGGAIMSWRWDGAAFRIVGMVPSDVLALVVSNPTVVTNIVKGQLGSAYLTANNGAISDVVQASAASASNTSLGQVTLPAGYVNAQFTCTVAVGQASGGTNAASDYWLYLYVSADGGNTWSAMEWTTCTKPTGSVTITLTRAALRNLDPTKSYTFLATIYKTAGTGAATPPQASVQLLALKS